jgi:hypothetical protein
MNEAWRYLDRRRRQGLCGQATPVVVLQDDSFGATDAITICAFTTDEIEAPACLSSRTGRRLADLSWPCAFFLEIGRARCGPSLPKMVRCR